MWLMRGEPEGGAWIPCWAAAAIGKTNSGKSNSAAPIAIARFTPRLPNESPLRISRYEKRMFTVTATVWPVVTGIGCGRPFKPSKNWLVNPPVTPLIGVTEGQARGVLKVEEPHVPMKVETEVTAKRPAGTTPDPLSV